MIDRRYTPNQQSKFLSKEIKKKGTKLTPNKKNKKLMIEIINIKAEINEIENMKQYRKLTRLYTSSLDQ